MDEKSCDEYVDAGARIVIVQMQITEERYDFTELSKLLNWRNKLQQPESSPQTK
jgi:hypothetical protein